MWTQMLVRPVNVISRPKAVMRGRIIEPNCCIEIINTGVDRQTINTSLLKILERDTQFVRISALPIVRHMNEVLLWEIFRRYAPIQSNKRRSQTILFPLLLVIAG